uniref:Uncharacterized protein n=1 Tax=Mycobacterium riyadhense TaxID=486698 RepID=A0A653EZN9_9MYCO|nr:hypothetical protein BIN_B_04744 [Mycobacterium riyadhense]
MDGHFWAVVRKVIDDGVRDFKLADSAKTCFCCQTGGRTQAGHITFVLVAGCGVGDNAPLRESFACSRHRHRITTQHDGVHVVAGPTNAYAAATTPAAARTAFGRTFAGDVTRIAKIHTSDSNHPHYGSSRTLIAVACHVGQGGGAGVGCMVEFARLERISTGSNREGLAEGHGCACCPRCDEAETGSPLMGNGADGANSSASQPFAGEPCGRGVRSAATSGAAWWQ